MGFLFARVMRFYSMNYREVMDLPIRAFWLLNDMLERVRADEQMKSLEVGLASGGGESCKDLSERLVKTVGSVLVLDPLFQMEEKLDEVGLNEIRGLGNTNK